jgi:exosortase/archaeosortase family protein
MALLRRRLLTLWEDDRARFVLAFSTLAGLLLGVYYFPRGSEDLLERWTADYLRLYTRLVARAIGAFDPLAMAHGNLVSGRFSMQIVKSCDAMEANILFAAALLAVAAPWLRKAIALVAGLAALLAFNVLRLFVLYWVGVFALPAFDFLHYDVWPLLMIVFAALDFVVCVRWVRGGPSVTGGGGERGAG